MSFFASLFGAAARERALKAEIEALAARVAALEAQVAVSSGERCKACGHLSLRRMRSAPSSGPFSRFGARDEVWICANCGDQEERLVVG